MNYMGLLFIVGFFFMLGWKYPQTDKAREVQTVQTLLLPVLIENNQVAPYFQGEQWLAENLSVDKVDINKYYQKSVFKRSLASTKSKKQKESTYSWIERRECSTSPYMDKPVHARITSRYGLRVHPLSGRRHVHAGIDFRGKTGTPVIAAAGGYVKSVNKKGAYGNTVIISHGHSYTTLYGHLSSYAIKEGEWVNQGQTLGYIGKTGRATGPHLHFEVRCHNVPVNPNQYLGQQGVAAEVRFRRKAPTYRKPFISKDPNYYTRNMNLQKLRDLKNSSIQ